VVWGARTSAILGVAAAALSVHSGSPSELASGLLGGLIDTVVMRVVDVILAVPRLPLLILVGTLAGAGRATLSF